MILFDDNEDDMILFKALANRREYGADTRTYTDRERKKKRERDRQREMSYGADR